MYIYIYIYIYIDILMIFNDIKQYNYIIHYNIRYTR